MIGELLLLILDIKRIAICHVEQVIVIEYETIQCAALFPICYMLFIAAITTPHCHYCSDSSLSLLFRLNILYQFTLAL